MPTCEFCGRKKGVKYIDLGVMTYICEECLSNGYCKCARCGQYNDPSFMYRLIDGNRVCSGCFDPDVDKKRPF